jgi:DNA-directed RNA polymerase specialized sigma24 family protein
MERMNGDDLRNALIAKLRRVYLYYFLGYSKSKIARLEGVDKSSIRRSIERALIQIKKKINEFL